MMKLMKTDEDLIYERYLKLNESLDNPYKWRNDFQLEDIEDDWDDSGEEYVKKCFKPTQIIKFQTDEGVNYVWYARQNRYNEVYWEIAFGIVEKKYEDGNLKLNIDKSGTGKPFRVFATVIDIINSFIEFDEDYEVQYLTFTSKGQNRTRLYKNYLIPKIEKFKIHYENIKGDETEFHLQRIF